MDHAVKNWIILLLGTTTAFLLWQLYDLTSLP
jgi:hypothetical protein